jgi:glutathione S-transferase
MFTLYAFPQTRATRAVWTLEEADLPYELVLVNLMKGEQRRAEYLALNPSGKVPTLVDGDFVLCESGAICTYLAERSPTARLAPPAGSRARACYDRWCFFVIGELEQPLWTIAKHTFALPEKLRVPAVIDTARQEFARATSALAQGLGDREYAVGDAFTAADIMLAHTLNWARGSQLPLGDERLEAYADRQLSRPALARARAREQAAMGAKD